MWAFSFPSHFTHSARRNTEDLMAPTNNNLPEQRAAAHRLPINVDLLAVGIALTLAALIRFGVIHQINF
jgi:hypothetical protein